MADIDDTLGLSPINIVEEIDTPKKMEKSVINTPATKTLSGALNPASPINNEAAQKQEMTETTGSAQSTITTKAGELKTEVPQVKPEEAKGININLENTKSEDTKKGEIFNSTSAVNTTNNTTTVDNTNSQDNTTSQTSVTNTETKPSINSDNKKSVFKSVVNELAGNAINSLNISNNPGLANDLVKYLKVGKDKLVNTSSPAINTYNTVKGAVDRAKNATTSVTNTMNAVNNSANTNTSTSEGTSNTQMTNSQVVVDTKSPVIPKDTSLAAPAQSTNTTNASLIEKSSQTNSDKSNSVTYSETSNPSSTEKKESQVSPATPIIQQGAPVNINLGELVNEMRAIKLLLMGGIDVNTKQSY